MLPVLDRAHKDIALRISNAKICTAGSGEAIVLNVDVHVSRLDVEDDIPSLIAHEILQISPPPLIVVNIFGGSTSD
jgi:hypothetical protein